VPAGKLEWGGCGKWRFIRITQEHRVWQGRTILESIEKDEKTDNWSKSGKTAESNKKKGPLMPRSILIIE